MSADGNDINGSVENEVISTGAAADSVNLDDKLKELPRLLRYAVLADRDDELIRQRLVADIAELAPGLASTIAWAANPGPDLGAALAAELDHLAVIKDKPDLRSLADCVRLLSLAIPVTDKHADDYRRLTKALLQALRRLPDRTDAELASKIEAIAFGWAALPAADDALSPLTNYSAGEAASRLGREMASWRVTAAETSLRHRFEERQRAREDAEKNRHDTKNPEATGDQVQIPADHVVVCRLSDCPTSAPVRQI